MISDELSEEVLSVLMFIHQTEIIRVFVYTQLQMVQLLQKILLIWSRYSKV